MYGVKIDIMQESDRLARCTVQMMPSVLLFII